MKWLTWVHSSVVRAADCRSAGPWFKSGCALLVLCCEWFGSQSPKHDTNASYTRRHLHIGGTHWKSLMGSAVVCNHCYHGKLSCISGLVVEYIVAIDVTRVRFPADAFRRLSFKALLNGVHWWQACHFQKLCEAIGSLSVAIDQKAWNYGKTSDSWKASQAVAEQCVAWVQFMGCRESIPPPWRFMLIKVTKNDATCCNVLNRTSSDKPVIAQLVEHLTVDSCSNQMVPGSIPGDRISWRYCRTNKHEASIRMLGIFDRYCFSCIIHKKF